MKPSLSFALPAVLLAVVLASHSIAAQSCPQVFDINQAPLQFSSEPTGRIALATGAPRRFTVSSGVAVFPMKSPGVGEELWRTDGTVAGTMMIADINPGPSGSAPQDFTVCGGQVFFMANQFGTGAELWVTDGTAAGTRLVRDIQPGPKGSMGRSVYAFMICVGPSVIFRADDGVHGQEAWISDGTTAGTRMLKDVYPGVEGSVPTYFTPVASGGVVFWADDGVHGRELWKTDGTTAGTGLLVDLIPGPSGSGFSGGMYPCNGVLLFEGPTDRELWRTDGTAAGTVLVREIRPGFSVPLMELAQGALLGKDFFFQANDGSTGPEVWKTDGTPGGTQLVEDTIPGRLGSDPGPFFAQGNQVYFSGRTNATGFELRKVQGNQTVLVKDLIPGTSPSYPAGFASLGSKFVFSAWDVNLNRNLFVSDGTGAGTVPLTSSAPGVGGQFLTSLGSRAVFAGDDARGTELWATDGTPLGTGLVFDFPGTYTDSSRPSALTNLGGEALVFLADDGIHGRELWSATPNGAVLLKDIRPGSDGSGISASEGFKTFVVGRRTVAVFAADDGIHGSEPWITDGTAAGTKLLRDIYPGTTESSPAEFTLFQGQIYFSAYGAAVGSELWVTDGTTAGTRVFADIVPGTGSSLVEQLSATGGRLYFSATNQTAGREPWYTDGSVAGTRMLADIVTGRGSSTPFRFTRVGSHVAFFAAGKLFASDGSPAGTKEIAPVFTYDFYKVAAFDGKFFFVGLDRVTRTGFEPWVSDLTVAGTGLLRDALPGEESSHPSAWRELDGVMYFLAGGKLHRTDGTQAGTAPVSGTMQAFGVDFVRGGGGFYHNAATDSEGTELAFSTGQLGGSRVVCETYPGSHYRPAGSMAVCDGVLYFVSESPAAGNELFMLAPTGATVERDPSGCGADVPHLDVTDPVLGATLKLSGRHAPAAGSRLLLIGVPVAPFHVPGLVWSGCLIYEDLSLPTMLLAHPAGTSWSLNLPLPNNSTLLGVQLSMQGVYAPQPLLLSDALRLTIGR